MRSSRSSTSAFSPSHGGQMVINMKTTVTTSGGQHNGLVVHSAVQSAASPSTSSSWIPSYIESAPLTNRRMEERIEMVRSNTSLNRDASPLPIQMVPSTSRETLTTTKSRDPSPNVTRRPPSPPASPIYSFKGRDSPPDEFIQPTKLILNVFRPPYREPQWQVPISRNVVNDSDGGISLSKRGALLNDALTTTTTVEVFRAPRHNTDDATPVVALPPSPFGGQPLLVRTDGPSYEQWTNEKRQTMLNGDDARMRGVQWKERLVDGSDYAEIPNEKPSPLVIHNDYRPNGNSSTFQPVTHPILSNSREDLSRYPYPRPTSQMSPLYIVPDRKYSKENEDYESPHHPRHHHHHHQHHRRSKSSSREDAARTRTTRNRSMSPVYRRGGVAATSQELVMSVPAHSPIGSTLMLASPDPNELPGDRRPASARSREIFALYQTRDAHNRIVDHL